MARLDVDPGETYTVGSGTTEDWEGATVDGTLVVDGTLELTDDGQGVSQDTQTDTPAGEVVPGSGGIDIPMSLPNTITMVAQGTAIFLMGLLGILLAAVWFLRNYAAGITWSLAVFALVAAGVFQIGLEMFWALIVGTVLMLIAGVVVRWMD